MNAEVSKLFILVLIVVSVKNSPSDTLLRACALLSQIVFFSADTRKNVITICNSTRGVELDKKGSPHKYDEAVVFRKYLRQRKIDIDGSVTVHYNRYSSSTSASAKLIESRWAQRKNLRLERLEFQVDIDFWKLRNRHLVHWSFFRQMKTLKTL